MADKYVVVADAVVVTTGTKKNGRPETTRVMHGAVITVNSPDNEHAAALIAAGSIVKATSKAHAEELKRTRQTAKMAAQAMGAPDDPVQPPVAGVEPIDAPVPQQSPEASVGVLPVLPVPQPPADA